MVCASRSWAGRNATLSRGVPGGIQCVRRRSFLDVVVEDVPLSAMKAADAAPGTMLTMTDGGPCPGEPPPAWL